MDMTPEDMMMLMGLTQWTPDSPTLNGATPTAWLKADAIIASDGDPVSTWPDSGPLGNDVVFSDAPTYKINIKNGYPAVRFNGTTNIGVIVNLFSAAYNKALAWFMIIQGNPQTQKVFINNNNLNFVVSKDKYNLITRFNAVSAGDKRTGESRIAGYTDWIDTFSYDGTRMMWMINGNILQIASTNNATLTGDLTVGDFGAGGFRFAWDVLEFGIYNSGLPQADLLQITDYLSLKYAIPKCTRRMVFECDSLTLGTGANVGADYPAQWKAAYGNSGDYIWNYGKGGQRVSTLSEETTRADPIANTDCKTIMCFWGGVNDLGDHADATTLYNNIVAQHAARRTAGFKTVAFTILPASFVAGADETSRQTVNSNIVSNWATFADALCDVAADARLSDYNNHTFFNADHIHLVDAGYAVVASLAQTAIASIP